MQVICISRAAYSGGQDLAQRLAEKLGYVCLSREELIEAAIKEGIQVGKLEMAMIKPSIFNEHLALEKEYYRAYTTFYLCDRALEGRLVYHGRTGHLLLPGISHVFRIRIVSDREPRARAAMKDLGLDRNKVGRYLEQVDEDWRRWVHSMYGVAWEDAAHYDVVINLEQMSVENAAAALTQMAQLPDFQMTPASKKAMLDLRLAAHCRLALARDKRTFGANFKVRADAGVVTVSYLPQESRYASMISDVISAVEGVSDLRTTMAATNILWVQQNFDSTSDTFGEVVEIATKWNAAVELVRLGPENPEEGPTSNQAEESFDTAVAENPPAVAYTGGIEDDIEEQVCEDGGLTETLDELSKLGLSGGGRVICGSADKLVSSLDRTSPYTLVVMGDLFLEKGHATRMRMIRELQSFVSDHIKAPVVTADELKHRYLFSKRDIIRSIGFVAVVVALYFLVFTHQESILQFLSGGWWKGKILAKVVVAAAVFLFIPIVAHSYGSVTKSLMKLIKIE